MVSIPFKKKKISDSDLKILGEPLPTILTLPREYKIKTVQTVKIGAFQILGELSVALLKLK